MSKMPPIDKIHQARYWLFAGAPAASRDYDSSEMVKILLMIVEGLPSIDPTYCHGTPENKAAWAAVGRVNQVSHCTLTPNGVK